jgi:hypothetical protein
MRRCCLLFLTLAISGQPLSPWLIPYPGAEGVTRTSLVDRNEVTYTTDRKPDEVVSHYQRLITAAGLPFVPGFDGLGTSIRAAAAECDLLVNVREQGTGTLVRASCASKSTSSTASAIPVGVIAPPKSRPLTMEERRRQGEEETRRVLAEAEAKHKKRIDDMKVYDQPVDARSRKKDAALPREK